MPEPRMSDGSAPPTSQGLGIQVSPSATTSVCGDVVPGNVGAMAPRIERRRGGEQAGFAVECAEICGVNSCGRDLVGGDRAADLVARSGPAPCRSDCRQPRRYASRPRARYPPERGRHEARELTFAGSVVVNHHTALASRPQGAVATPIQERRAPGLRPLVVRSASKLACRVGLVVVERGRRLGDDLLGTRRRIVDLDHRPVGIDLEDREVAPTERWQIASRPGVAASVSPSMVETFETSGIVLVLRSASLAPLLRSKGRQARDVAVVAARASPSLAALKQVETADSSWRSASERRQQPA